VVSPEILLNAEAFVFLWAGAASMRPIMARPDRFDRGRGAWQRHGMDHLRT
jgi:hypothetical protein